MNKKILGYKGFGDCCQINIAQNCGLKNSFGEMSILDVSSAAKYLSHIHIAFLMKSSKQFCGEYALISVFQSRNMIFRDTVMYGNLLTGNAGVP